MIKGNYNSTVFWPSVPVEHSELDVLFVERGQLFRSTTPDSTRRVPFYIQSTEWYPNVRIYE